MNLKNHFFLNFAIEDLVCGVKILVACHVYTRNQNELFRRTKQPQQQKLQQQ